VGSNAATAKRAGDGAAGMTNGFLVVMCTKCDRLCSYPSGSERSEPVTRVMCCECWELHSGHGGPCKCREKRAAGRAGDGLAGVNV
jgi:hypothetical protein